MFTITSDGTIQTDSIDDAVALAQRLRAPQGPPPMDEPIPFKVPGVVSRKAVLKTVKPVAAAVQVTATKGQTIVERATRERGTGSLFQVASGRWRYSLGGGGTPCTAGTCETRAEAELELDALVAKKTGRRAPSSPAPKVAKAKADDEPAPASVTFPPLPVFSIPAAQVEVIEPSNPAYLHPGAGWGPVDEHGLSKHLTCKGRGCDICKKQGVRRCEPRQGKLDKPSLAAMLGRTG